MNAIIIKAQKDKMKNNEIVQTSLFKLKNYIETNRYKGFDPYDALKSPIFELPFFKSNKLVRFGTQQMVKRLPFNIRPLLFVPKGYNPVTLGLSIQAYAYLYEVDKNEEYIQNINFLIKELKALIPEGFSGACWGYDFDWEARYARIAAYQPTVVATGIITNALYIAYKITGVKEAAQLVESSAEFVLKDLNRTYTDELLCFSYSPFDNQQVFNASMKGARLLVQSYSISGNEKHKGLAKQAIEFVIFNQKEDGSWGYSLANAGDWIDNYHTGYIIDCIDEYQSLANDLAYKDNIKKGYDFYIKHFVSDKGEPKFYHNKLYPIDCTAAAQTILTTLRFNDKEIAKHVADFIVKTMQKSDGSFRFRKFNNYMINTSFMRWSDAWMFVSLSKLQGF